VSQAAPPTPHNVAASAGAKWINSKVDEIPDCNRLADTCEVPAGVDALAVVKACIPVAEAVAWVIECRLLAKAREKAKQDAIPGADKPVSR
jgi:hypothetical protein